MTGVIIARLIFILRTTRVGMPPNNQRDKDTNMTTKNQETPKPPVTKALPSSAGPIPLLEMATNPQNGYGLMNWNQVDQWGYANHPTWHQVHKMALYRGLDEVTKLRVLSDALMRQNVELKERCEEMMVMLDKNQTAMLSDLIAACDKTNKCRVARLDPKEYTLSKPSFAND